ncbi:MAG: hypothetical protein DRH20_02600 [Deltaproteobacteria bacterium]|nr:MAG: hypothetical protein DRH20_02600 [Deltaproteobacteria bacterium]
MDRTEKPARLSTPGWNSEGVLRDEEYQRGCEKIQSDHQNGGRASFQAPGRIVHGTVEETLNAFLDSETDRVIRAPSH